jgi:hypothetical protein
MERKTSKNRRVGKTDSLNSAAKTQWINKSDIFHFIMPMMNVNCGSQAFGDKDIF